MSTIQDGIEKYYLCSNCHDEGWVNDFTPCQICNPGGEWRNISGEPKGRRPVKQSKPSLEGMQSAGVWVKASEKPVPQTGKQCVRTKQDGDWYYWTAFATGGDTYFRFYPGERFKIPPDEIEWLDKSTQPTASLNTVEQDKRIADLEKENDRFRRTIQGLVDCEYLYASELFENARKLLK